MIYYVMEKTRRPTVVAMFHDLVEARKAVQANDRYFLRYGEAAINLENRKQEICNGQ